MSQIIEKQIIDLVSRSNKILIMPSSPLDGDSLGSAIALYLTLKKLGKEPTVVCSEAVPELLQFLPNVKVIGHQISSSKDFIVTLNCQKVKIAAIREEVMANQVHIIITPEKGSFSNEDISFSKGILGYDLIITVDCAELTQLKTIYENNIEMFHEVPVINIDHHISNTHFGRINHIDVMASSTAELLLPLLEEMSRKVGTELIDEDIATLLLAGIITDTGSFQNANTTPKAFAVAAQLISYGARQQEIIQHVYKTKQLSQLKLWGRLLSKIQIDDTYRIVWSTATQKDFRDTGSNEDQTGDIIDELMTNAPGSEVVLLLKERKDGSISVSIRTTNASVDASRIAEHFGGGGHTQAAGFTLKNTNLRDTEYNVLKYVREFQTSRLSPQSLSEEKKQNAIEELFGKVESLKVDLPSNKTEPKKEDGPKITRVHKKSEDKQTDNQSDYVSPLKFSPKTLPEKPNETAPIDQSKLDGPSYKFEN